MDRPGIDLACDILDLHSGDIPFEPGEVDAVLASPDCTAFSVANIRVHWKITNSKPIPKTAKAINRIQLVRRTISLIEYLKPHYYVIENPRGMLRKLEILNHLDRREIWYCHYGENRAKPTDLWGGFPPSFQARPSCHNRQPQHADDCCCRDHAAAFSGTKSGTQSLDKNARSFIPYELACDIFEAVQKG